MSPSAISEHTDMTDHYSVWNKVKFNEKESHWYTCRINEAIYMRLNPYNINRDNGMESPEAWMSMIKIHNNRRTVQPLLARTMEQ